MFHIVDSTVYKHVLESPACISVNLINFESLDPFTRELVAKSSLATAKLQVPCVGVTNNDGCIGSVAADVAKCETKSQFTRLCTWIDTVLPEVLRVSTHDIKALV